MSRPTQNNRYSESGTAPKFSIKGINVMRLLVALLLVLNFALIYAILYSSNGISGYKKQNEQVRELEEKLIALKTENQKLFEMIQALKSSPKAQEKLVRQELGWVREDEIIMESAGKESEAAEKPAGPMKPFSLPK